MNNEKIRSLIKKLGPDWKDSKTLENFREYLDLPCKKICKRKKKEMFPKKGQRKKKNETNEIKK